MNNRNWFHSCVRDANPCADRSAAPRFTFVFGILCVLFLFLTTAQAQSAVDYRFLEVVDTAGQPIVNAKVETNTSTHQTDEKGSIEKLPVGVGDFNTMSIKVSKPGYVTFEDIGFFGHDRWLLLTGENRHFDPYGPIKIELLKSPVTSAERKVVEREQQNQELLLATRQGDAATVRRLLQAGGDANARDMNGIPVVLWAVTNGDMETIKALLSAGADVRSKDKPGRRALLYYLYYLHGREINYELVRRLLKAGADVSAANSFGTTALLLAKDTENTQLIRQLERAGAQHK